MFSGVAPRRPATLTAAAEVATAAATAAIATEEIVSQTYGVRALSDFQSWE